MPIWHNESRPPERAGFSLHRAGGRLRGIFSFHGKRISPFDPQEKGIRIVSEQLEELQCLPIALPIARRSRVGLCYTTWLAPTIRCRSAHLVEVQTNFLLPPVSSMRRAQQCRYFARSLPPCYRHSRLTIVRRGCWMCRIAGIHGEAMYTAPDCAARAALQATSPQCEFSLGGCKGGVSLFEKEIPLPYPRPPHQVGKNRNLLFQKEPCDIFYCNRSLSNGKHLKHMPHPLADLQAAGNVCALHRLIELF